MLKVDARGEAIERLHDGRCPRCRTRIVVASPADTVIRNAILRVDRAGRVAAKCARCKTWVEVPLRYVG
jgi:DNA-directed RNA polymerase subunit RPC12/RpoP